MFFTREKHHGTLAFLSCYIKPCFCCKLDKKKFVCGTLLPMTMFEIKDISESTLNRVSSSVIEEVRIFINNLQRRSCTDAELEIRLGRYENGRFISNIEEKSWQRLLESLESQQGRSSLFVKVKDWTEIVDWFFTVPREDGGTIQMRSSRTVENDTMVRRHLIKKRSQSRWWALLATLTLPTRPESRSQQKKT